MSPLQRRYGFENRGSIQHIARPKRENIALASLPRNHRNYAHEFEGHEAAHKQQSAVTESN